MYTNAVKHIYMGVETTRLGMKRVFCPSDQFYIFAFGLISYGAIWGKWSSLHFLKNQEKSKFESFLIVSSGIESLGGQLSPGVVFKCSQSIFLMQCTIKWEKDPKIGHFLGAQVYIC